MLSRESLLIGCLLLSWFLLYDFLEPKTVIITGANSGIGFTASRILTSTRDYRVIFACRSAERANQAILSLSKAQQEYVEFNPLDLNDLTSVKAFSDRWKDRKIDALVLNAGIQVGNDKKVALRSKQGYEQTIAVNHLGHFLLVNLLLPSINPEKGRIVFTASGVHNPEEPGGNVGSKASLGEMKGLQQGFRDPISMISHPAAPFDPDKAYKDSKLCNVMTTLALARRLQESGSTITCNCFNPGLVPTTKLFRAFNPVFTTLFTIATKYLFRVGISEEEAGQRLVYMITNPTLNGQNGKYYSGRPGKHDYQEIRRLEKHKIWRSKKISGFFPNN